MGRTMSVFYGSLNVGVIAGGPLGGVVAHLWGLRSPLFVYAGLCFVSGMLYLRFMPDPNQHRTSRDLDPTASAPVGWQQTRSQIAALLRDRAFLAVVIVNMAFFWVVAGGYDTLVPLFARERLGLSPVGVGGMFAIVVTTEFLVLYPAGSASDRLGRKRVLLPALVGLALMTAAIGWASSPLLLGVLMGVVGFASGSAASGPSAMLADIAPEGGSGTAVGVFRFFGDLGFVLGPVVGGAAASAFGFKAAFAVTAIPVVGALVLVARAPETLHRPAPSRPAAGALDEEPGLL
jgi:MFS family permease